MTKTGQLYDDNVLITQYAEAQSHANVDLYAHCETNLGL